MMTLDEIKKLMAAGETAEADKALKELLEKEPNNLQAKMLYGTCRQLLGDEETFKRIHDELAPVMEKRKKDVPDEDEAKCWERFDKLFRSQNQDALCVKRKSAMMEYVVLAVLIIAAIAGGIILFGDNIKAMIQTMCGLDPMSVREEDVLPMNLYAGEWYYDKEKSQHKFTKTFDEDVDTSK